MEVVVDVVLILFRKGLVVFLDLNENWLFLLKGFVLCFRFCLKEFNLFVDMEGIVGIDFNCDDGSFCDFFCCLVFFVFLVVFVVFIFINFFLVFCLVCFLVVFFVWVFFVVLIFVFFVFVVWVFGFVLL